MLLQPGDAVLEILELELTEPPIDGPLCFDAFPSGAAIVEHPDDDAALRKQLVETVRKVIGPIASPDKIQFAPGLPKTRSGKIMRRILRKIAEGKMDEVGDVTTLSDPSVVESLVKNRV